MAKSLGRVNETAITQIIDEWNQNASGEFSPEFEALLYKTFLYITAKTTVKEHRAFGILTKRCLYALETTRMNFCITVHKIFCRHAATRFFSLN